ncbi:MAG: hypothetical protein IKS28_04875 [Clostridia bacterium]|nr:hypothetical protein [Clostridia bacterium]
MKSDVIHIVSTGTGIKAALDQAERTALFEGLGRKEAIRLRLLTEEMLGMFEALTNEIEADFWIEVREGQFTIHLLTDTVMTSEKREQLLAASTTGENNSAKGVMSKIRDIFERALEPVNAVTPKYFSGGWFSPSTYGAAVDTAGPIEAEIWSLNQYRASLQGENSAEAWDELEKSIVASLADEVRIGILGGRVEMEIVKTF